MSRALRHAVVGLLLSLSVAAVASAVTFYSQDEAHLWNRLHTALVVRTSVDGVVEDDLLDPPLWRETKHLLAGESNRQAVTLLGEFSRDRDSLATMTLLQRAHMQRDLLGVFCWLMADGRGALRGAVPEHRALATGIARAIRHVALSPAEIIKLPGNYAAAAALPEVAKSFSPEADDRPFLPPDLLVEDGDWIALQPQGDDGLAATRHFQAFHGRSAFEVRFRHPAGRAAGEAYLAELAAMPQPWVKERPENRNLTLPNVDRGPWINPQTPQLPVGSMWALVRLAVLVAPDGTPFVSPLVESVQIRVYRDIAGDAQRAQRFFEWEMRRALLLDGGGFHATEPREQIYRHFFTHGFDPFERREMHAKSPERPARTTLGCYTCHSGPGIHSIASRSPFFQGQLADAPAFRAGTRGQLTERTRIEARKLPVWELLSWMMGEP